jgi:hypothetical protein
MTASKEKNTIRLLFLEIPLTANSSEFSIFSTPDKNAMLFPETRRHNLPQVVTKIGISSFYLNTKCEIHGA